MGRIYTAQFSGVAVTAQQDLFELVAPATGVVAIHGLDISQITEVGDAAEEGLLVQFVRGHTTSGSGGSSVTPQAADQGDAAFAGTCEANNTTIASAGTAVYPYSWSWNVRIPLIKIWTPETRPILAPSEIIAIRLGTTPGDSITMAGTIEFEEIGG